MSFLAYHPAFTNHGEGFSPKNRETNIYIQTFKRFQKLQRCEILFPIATLSAPYIQGARCNAASSRGTGYKERMFGKSLMLTSSLALEYFERSSDYAST